MPGLGTCTVDSTRGGIWTRVKGGEARRRKGEDGRRGDEGEQVGSVVMGETGDSTVRSIMLSYG